MISAIRETFGSLLSIYPEKYRVQIRNLKRSTEEQLAECIDEILTKPQSFTGFRDKMLLTDAIAKAVEFEENYLEMEAPLLTFPRATSTVWNGDRDHVDTIRGTYTIFTGGEYDRGDLKYMRTFKGAPQFITAFKKVLGPNFHVTMKVDANKVPASRIIVVFNPSLY